jgi:hypothetical protein
MQWNMHNITRYHGLRVVKGVIIQLQTLYHSCTHIRPEDWASKYERDPKQFQQVQIHEILLLEGVDIP